MGTTWLFNVIKRMITVADIPLAVVADGVPRPSKSWGGAVLVKSHRADSPRLIREFDSRMNLYGLVMMRDPEATLASLLRTQNAERAELMRWLETDVDSYSKVLPQMRSAIVIREEWIAEEASHIVGAVYQLLKLGLPVPAQQKIAREFSRERVREHVANLESDRHWNGGFQNFDRETQWHAGHIGPDGPQSVALTTEERVRVDHLRAQVSHLTQQFGIWSYIPSTVPTDTSTPAIEFVRARDHESLQAMPLQKRIIHQVTTILKKNARS